MQSWLKHISAWAFSAGLCLSTAAAALPLRGDEPIAEIPYRLAYQGWFTVEAEVNGTGPHDFIVDSGATITSVFSNLAAAQDFSRQEGRTIQIVGLSGAQELPAYFLGEIDFSGIGLRDHLGVILPDWAEPNTPPQGVMGLDLMTQYAVFFDTEDSVIRFYDPALRHEYPRRWGKTKMTPLKTQGPGAKLYTITVKVGPARIPCVVDLGASGTVFNTPALRAMVAGVRYSTAEDRRLMTTGTHINDIFDISERVRPVRIQQLRIGGASWRNRVFVVYDAQIFADLGFERKPFCLVGADIFDNRNFMFDFSRQTLHIGPKHR